jgi:hypothetical protein
MGYLIAIISIVIAGSIPITAIITAHMRSKERIKLQLMKQEMELELVRLKGYEQETEKLRLELQQEKTLLLEEKR